MPIATISIPPLTEKLQALFWARVNKNGPTQPHMETPCWQWTRVPRKGYGVFWIGRKRHGSHRIALTIAAGQIPDNLFVMHLCDNPVCCNPAHLRAGTCRENIRDASRKGRIASGDRSGPRIHIERMARGDRNGARLRPERLPRGDDHGMSKLTAEKVREMRRRYSVGGITQKTLAREFSVSQGNVYSIIHRKTWAHVS